MSIHVLAPVLVHEFPDVAAADSPSKVGVSAQTLKLVMIAVADSADENGLGARHSVRYMAKIAQCHVATVQRALAVLQKLGYLTIERASGPRHPTWYSVDLTRLGCPQGSRDATPQSARHATPERASDATPERASDATHSVYPSIRRADSPAPAPRQAPSAEEIERIRKLNDPVKRAIRQRARNSA